VLQRSWVNQLAQDTYSLQVYDSSGTPITVVDVTGDGARRELACHS
jgi:hypothetical protein